MRFVSALVWMGILLWSGTAWAVIYTWTDPGGKEHFTDDASYFPKDLNIEIKVMKGTTPSRAPAKTLAVPAAEPPAEPEIPREAKLEEAPEKPQPPPVDQEAIKKKLMTYRKLVQSSEKMRQGNIRKLQRLDEYGDLGGAGTNRGDPDEMYAGFEKEVKRLTSEIDKYNQIIADLEGQLEPQKKNSALD